MGQVIKVRCHGANRHVNEVDVDDAMRLDSISRSVDFSATPAPERTVLRCRECAEGKVIVTRAMIEAACQ